VLAPNTILQNRYRIVRELGHGGMGTVYEAVDQRVNCIVALKETTAGNDGEAKRAFEREASLLANLRHSTLPKVMDYFTEGDGDFLVMEFIPGYDLAELLDSRESPFPQSQVLRWAFELLRVLEYLHKQEPPILHRDIKPSNLKLTKNGEVFLLDFGLAKGALGQMPTLAASRSVRGYTPIYASLEQIHGHGTDPRSDLYSLAATLYHLLSGIPPVDAPTRFHVVEDGEPDPLEPIQKINLQASPNVTAVIHQTMALRRKDRPVSAAEMSRALRNAAEEDERNAAEEEYRRAEERRRLRAEQAKGVVPATKGSEKKPGARTDESEDEEPRPKTGSTAPQPRTPPLPPTVVAPTDMPAKPKDKKASPPLVPTMVAPPPERVHSVPDTKRAYESYAGRKSHTGIIIAAVVVVALIGGLIVWLMSGSSTNENANASPTSQASSNSGPANAPAAPAGMVYVPGGTFTMGRDNGADEAERPEHQVTVKPFFIDVNEVSVEDHLKTIPTPIGQKGRHLSDDEKDKPTVGLSWDAAYNFCKDLGQRLPTEEEWEFAARGTDGRIYPWGNNWQANAANAAGESSGVKDVGSYKKGASPFGAYDMVGNVWEWTSSDFRAYPGGRLPSGTSGGDLKVIRGGSYESSKAYATTTYRTGWPARSAKTYDQTGFRCVKDVQ
jgi:serine/threonine protein kinase